MASRPDDEGSSAEAGPAPLGPVASATSEHDINRDVEDSTPEDEAGHVVVGSSSSSPSAARSCAEEGWRVKVYRLRDTGGWDDQGVGRIRGLAHSTLPLGTNWCLAVEAETPDGRPGGERWIIRCPIHADEAYTRQGRTIISWLEQPAGVELALSFQEDSGCDEIWEDISTRLNELSASASPAHKAGFSLGNNSAGGGNGALHGSGGGIRSVLEDDDLDSDLLHQPVHLGRGVLSSDEEDFDRDGFFLELRKATFETLPELLAKVERVNRFPGMDSLSENLVRDRCVGLDSLLNAALQAESHGNLPALHAASHLLTLALSEARPALLDRCCAPHRFLAVAAVCEYDPALPVRPRHRIQLLTRTFFVEVLRALPPVLVRRAQQAFRLGFLKDVLAPRVADDALTATIDRLVSTCKSEIVSAFAESDRYFSSLVALLCRWSCGEFRGGVPVSDGPTPSRSGAMLAQSSPGHIILDAITPATVVPEDDDEDRDDPAPSMLVESHSLQAGSPVRPTPSPSVTINEAPWFAGPAGLHGRPLSPVQRPGCSVCGTDCAPMVSPSHSVETGIAHRAALGMLKFGMLVTDMSDDEASDDTDGDVSGAPRKSARRAPPVASVADGGDDEVGFIRPGVLGGYGGPSWWWADASDLCDGGSCRALASAAASGDAPPPATTLAGKRPRDDEASCPSAKRARMAGREERVQVVWPQHRSQHTPSGALRQIYELLTAARGMGVLNQRGPLCESLLRVQHGGQGVFSGLTNVLVDPNSSRGDVLLALEVLESLSEVNLQAVRTYCVADSTSRGPPSVSDVVAAFSSEEQELLDETHDPSAVEAAVTDSSSLARPLTVARTLSASAPLMGSPVELTESQFGLAVPPRTAAVRARLTPASAPLDEGAIRISPAQDSGQRANKARLNSLLQRKARRRQGEHGTLVAISPNSCLLQALIWRLVDDPEPGIQQGAASLLCTLLGSDVVRAADRSSLLEVVFQSHFEWLIQPFTCAGLRIAPAVGITVSQASEAGRALQGRDGGEKWKALAGRMLAALLEGSKLVGGESQASKASKMSVVDVLLALLSADEKNFSYHAVRSGLLPRVLQLLRYPEPHMQLPAIRFLRACVQASVAFLGSVIEERDLFGPVFGLLAAGRGRPTLVASSIGELMQETATRKSRPLLQYIGHRYSQFLEERKSIPSFQALLREYDWVRSSTLTLRGGRVGSYLNSNLTKLSGDDTDSEGHENSTDDDEDEDDKQGRMAGNSASRLDTPSSAPVAPSLGEWGGGTVLSDSSDLIVRETVSIISQLRHNSSDDEDDKEDEDDEIANMSNGRVSGGVTPQGRPPPLVGLGTVGNGPLARPPGNGMLAIVDAGEIDGAAPSATGASSSAPLPPVEASPFLDRQSFAAQQGERDEDDESSAVLGSQPTTAARRSLATKRKPSVAIHLKNQAP
jgi:hypothetical protein